jgi:hypothetical protein
LGDIVGRPTHWTAAAVIVAIWLGLAALAAAWALKTFRGG